MSETEASPQFQLMAAAIYEMRCLLSDGLGSENSLPENIRLASHLAYSLHNEALEVIEGKWDFRIAAAQERIRTAQSIVGSQYADGFGLLGSKELG